MNEKIIFYLLLFFFASTLGWVGECIYCSTPVRKFINRGFLTGPLCPIYGCGALILTICIVPFREYPYVVPFLAMLLCDILEFMTSWIMEKLFHARWWDYSNKKFNIQGRICLGHTIYWGVGSLLYVYLVYPLIEEGYSFVPVVARPYILGAILLIFFIDLLNTLRSALDIKALITKLHTFRENTKDATEQLSFVRDTIVNDTKLSMERRKKIIQDSVLRGGEKMSAWFSQSAEQLIDYKTQFEHLGDNLDKTTKKAARLLRVTKLGEVTKMHLDDAEKSLDRFNEQFNGSDETDDNETNHPTVN